MILTPDILHATYDYMRVLQPFRSWKLPLGDEIAFKVTAEETSGYCQPINDEHWIAISTKGAGMISTVQKIMGHELIHLKQMLAKTQTSGEHNEEFRDLAKRVCKEWNWDVRDFYF